MFNVKQIIFLVVVTLFSTYVLGGVVILYKNDYSLLFILQHYRFDFTLEALLNNYPKTFESLVTTFIASGLFSLLLSFALKEKKALHGAARFAKYSEIKNKMKMLNDSGLIIGKYKNQYLRFKSQEFVSVGAPTRSGKGVSIVIPNLLEYDESCVVLDIKQECFDITSKYRQDKLGQKVYLFNPFDFRTHRYNPLSYIDMQNPATRDNDLMDFTNLLYPISGGDSTTIFFNQQAQNLFIGICYLYRDLQTDKGREFCAENNIVLDFTMYHILKLSQGFSIPDPDPDSEEDGSVNGFDESVQYLEHLEILSPEAKEKLNNYLTIESQNTKSGVLSSFNAPLLIYQNEPIKSATAASDFDLTELRKKKITLYIGISPDKLAIAKPILNIFFSQLISLNTKELPARNKELKYSCLLLMDEFTSIGNMPVLLKGVAYVAGYNLRLLTIFQTDSQLEAPPPEGYGREGAKTLLANHSVKVWFAPDDEQAAERLSKRLGDVTVRVVSRGSSSNGSMFQGSSSKNVSEQKRALMLPQELMELGFENQLITKANNKPILCKKVLYYQDPYFIAKLQSVSSSLKKAGQKPSQKDFEYATMSDELNIPIPTQGGFTEK